MIPYVKFKLDPTTKVWHKIGLRILNGDGFTAIAVGTFTDGAMGVVNASGTSDVADHTTIPAAVGSVPVAAVALYCVPTATAAPIHPQLGGGAQVSTHLAKFPTNADLSPGAICTLTLTHAQLTTLAGGAGPYDIYAIFNMNSQDAFTNTGGVPMYISIKSDNASGAATDLQGCEGLNN